MILPMARLVEEFDVRPRTIVHVGAHLGEEAEAYAAAGAARVLWVEANPDLLQPLRTRIAGYPGHTAVRAAVSDADDAPATLHLCTFPMASSLLAPKEHLAVYPSMAFPRALEVRTVTLDTLLAREGLPPGSVDFLNLDIQGAELHALRGATETLAGVRWVYTEVNYRELYAGCAFADEIHFFLWERGFECAASADEGPQYGWGDALYTRRGGVA